MPDSSASPLVKTPTIVHSLSRRATVSPDRHRREFALRAGADDEFSEPRLVEPSLDEFDLRTHGKR